MPPTSILTLHTKVRRAVAAIILGGALLGGALGTGAIALAGPSAAHAAAKLATLRPGTAVSARIAGAGDGAPAARAAAAQKPLAPAQIRAAYSLPATGARNQRIAVVSIYDAPHLQADLNAYDKKFRLRSCTSANHCFRKLNQEGRSQPLPETDPSGGQWITESSLGVEIARGVCQTCSIMLVEADAGDDGDVAQAIAAAGKAGATVIVTAITPVESDTDSYWASHDFPERIPIVAATGDAPLGSNWGYGEANFPSSWPNVLAVGGTQLRLGPRGGYESEQAWSKSVSGCSNYNRAAAWQTRDAAKVDCGGQRAVADVSAMAAPGAIVHITGVSTKGGPWYVASGTSLAAPIIAGTIGLAGSMGANEIKTLYARAESDPRAFHDVVKGATASPCKNPICMAVRGYDGPTGLGTPHGLAAFLPPGRHAGA